MKSRLNGQNPILTSCSSVKLLSHCSLCVPSLQLFSNFCIMMFFRLFFLQLCVTSEPPLLPPQITERFWMRVRSRRWWKKSFECPTRKNVNDGENHAFPGRDSARSGVTGDARGNSAVYLNAPKIQPILAYPTQLNQKMLRKRPDLEKSNHNMLFTSPVPN